MLKLAENSKSPKIMKIFCENVLNFKNIIDHKYVF